MAHRAVFGRAGWRNKSKFNSFFNSKIQYFTFKDFLLIDVNMIEVEIYSLEKGQRSAAHGFLYKQQPWPVGMTEDSPPDTVSWYSLSSCVLARRTSSCRGSKCSCRTPSCSSRRSAYTAPACALAQRWRSFSCASDRGTCAGSAPSEDGTGRAEEPLAAGTMPAGRDNRELAATNLCWAADIVLSNPNISSWLNNMFAEAWGVTVQFQLTLSGHLTMGSPV